VPSTHSPSRQARSCAPIRSSGDLEKWTVVVTPEEHPIAVQAPFDGLGRSGIGAGRSLHIVGGGSLEAGEADANGAASAGSALAIPEAPAADADDGGAVFVVPAVDDAASVGGGSAGAARLPAAHAIVEALATAKNTDGARNRR
jgi:hypothetical protein